MASKFYASASVFKKVTGFENGPCKPTISTSNTTADAAEDIATTAINSIASLQPGESVNIVVQCVETRENS